MVKLSMCLMNSLFRKLRKRRNRINNKKWSKSRKMNKGSSIIGIALIR
jgi:hypothetical protein